MAEQFTGKHFGWAIMSLVLMHVPSAVSGAVASDCPLLLAHRGIAGYYPANTVPAFLAALGDGFDGVELDVRISNDGVAIVSHDDRLGVATSCNGRIGLKSSAEIAGCRVLRTTLIPESRVIAQTAHVSAPIPQLQYVLADLLPRPQMRALVIDIKPLAVDQRAIDALQRAIVGCGKPCSGTESKLTFITQDPTSTELLKEAFPLSHVALESNRTISGLIDYSASAAHWQDQAIDTYSLSYNSLFDPKLRVAKWLLGQPRHGKERFARFVERNAALPKPRRMLGWTINNRAGIAGLHGDRFDIVLTDFRRAQFAKLWRASWEGVGKNCFP